MTDGGLGWAGMWIWAVIAALVVVLLVVVINKLSKKIIGRSRPACKENC
jgi:uncharacterized membrane protein